MSEIESDDNEQMPACVRCGEPSWDLRTLWMSCLYAMHELKDVPFEQRLMKGGTLHEYLGEEVVQPYGFKAPKFSEESVGQARDQSFYTLRVCKSCRSEWMHAIRDWFVTLPTRRESCGTGIFVRDCGALVEITEEEWRERYGNREPVRVSKDV